MAPPLHHMRRPRRCNRARRRIVTHARDWRAMTAKSIRTLALAAFLLLVPALAFADTAPPKIEEVAKSVADTTTSINFVWTLVAGFLVMFMQAGFALVETGFTRAKNASHTMAMNFMVYGIAMIAYWAIGFGLPGGGLGALGTLGGYDQLNHAFTVTIAGKQWPLFGMRGFFLTGVAYNASVFAYFLFQMVFMDTTATIPTGALAERWKFSAFCVFSLFVGGVISPLFASAASGCGSLSQLGASARLCTRYADSAGSGAAH